MPRSWTRSLSVRPCAVNRSCIVMSKSGFGHDDTGQRHFKGDPCEFIAIHIYNAFCAELRCQTRMKPTDSVIFTVIFMHFWNVYNLLSEQTCIILHRHAHWHTDLSAVKCIPGLCSIVAYLWLETLQEGVLDGLGAAFRVLAHVEVNELGGLALCFACS